jgi:hypothetical protein
VIQILGRYRSVVTNSNNEGRGGATALASNQSSINNSSRSQNASRSGNLPASSSSNVRPGGGIINRSGNNGNGQRVGPLSKPRPAIREKP